MQQSDSVIYTYMDIYMFFFKLFSTIGYDMILNIVLCALQKDFVYPFSIY